MKKVITPIIIVIAVFLVWLLLRSPEKVPDVVDKPTPTITYTNSSANLIKVDLPFPGAVVGKEFSVIGQARGYWFFEASFPVQLLDKDDNVLATGIAQAQPDSETGEINWMTENFVPFKADLKAPASYIGPATLILHKDNPSGLPEHDASISFPITIEY